MINIKVLECTDKETKFGKPMKALKIEAENETRAVNLFSNFPDFANIKLGSVFLANMTKEGNYWNLSYDGQEKSSMGQNYPNKTASIAKAMEKKEASIEKFQSSKEESIKLSSAQRDAVLIVKEMMSIGQWDKEEVVKKEIIKWRNWFLLSKDFNEIPPFN